MQQKIFMGLALTLIIAIFIPLYWATEPGRQETARERQYAEVMGRGGELYTSSCASCHGTRGEGNIGPTLKGTHFDEGALEKIIARGIPGTVMIAWGEEDDGPLKKHQIKDLVTFIKNWDGALVTATEGKVRRDTLAPQPSPSPLPATTTLTEPGQTIFEQKCSGCHTIGGGQLVGPDLKNVTGRREKDWLIRFIVNPEQYGTGMPNIGVSESEVKEVLAYIQTQSRGEPSAAPPEQDTEKIMPLPIGDTSIGRDIFIGKTPLNNGGTACLSCHNVGGIGALGGGSMGKDLTEAYSVIGEPGLTSILKTPPFPIMKEIYEERPLEDSEVADLVAFLEETDAEQSAAGQNPFAFIMIGIAGLLLIVIILQITWRGRLSGVRQSLVKGGSK